MGHLPAVSPQEVLLAEGPLSVIRRPLPSQVYLPRVAAQETGARIGGEIGITVIRLSAVASIQIS